MKQLLMIVLILTSMAQAQRLLMSSEELLEAVTIGGTYRLAEGRYEFEETLVIDKSLTLIGEGATTTIIASASLGDTLAVSVENAGHVTFRHIGIERLGEASGDVLGILDSSFVLSHCIVRGGVFTEVIDDVSYGDGLYLYGEANGVVLSSVIIDNDLVGVRLVDSSRLRLIDSLVAQNLDIGVSVADGASLMMIDSEVVDNLEGVHIEGTAHIIDSAIYDSSQFAGIGLYEQGQLLLRGSEVYANSDGAINIFDQAVGLIENSNLSANDNTGLYVGDNAAAWLYGATIVRNQGEGIYMDGDGFVLVQDSEIANNSESGVFLQERARAVINNTVINSNQEFRGVDAADQAAVVVVDSRFKSNGTGALSIVGEATAILSMSTLIGPGQDDSEVYIGADAQAVLSDSLFDTSDGVAVLVSDNARVHVMGSEFRQHAFRAIEANGQGRLWLSGSSLSDNSGSAVGLYDQAWAMLLDNTMTANESSAIYLEDDSFAYIGANQLRNNDGSGVFFAAGSGIVSDNEISDNLFNGVEAKANALALVTNNTITGHYTADGNAAVFIHEEASVLVIDNDLSANNYGIFIRDQARLSFRDNVFENNDVDVEDSR